MYEPGHEGGHDEDHHLSPWPIVVGTGIPLVLAGLLFLPYGPIPGIALFLAGLGGWVWSDLSKPSRSWMGDSEEAAAFGLEGITLRKLAVWIFLANETVFFSSLITTSWSLRTQTALWMLPGEVLNIPITALNTFILIVSSFTVVMALDQAQQGNLVRMRRFLLATLILGVTFVSIQAIEYWLLFSEHMRPWEAPKVLRSAGDAAVACAAEAGIYHGGHVPSGCQVVQLPAVVGATFYTQTGFHGAHVTAGNVALAYLTVKAYRGGFTQENHEALEIVGLYWHFVDVVWILLFTIVYLI